MGESSTVKAQRLANETNERMNTENNALKQKLADEANELNYKMFQEQNAWNLERRNEEWAYNDPSAQMERLLKAGINPIMAASQVTAGTAQPLTSADSPPAEVADVQAGHVIPEDGEVRDKALFMEGIKGIEQSMQNAINGYLGVKQLNMQERESSSRINLNEAEAAYKRSSSRQIQLANEENVKTFGTRLKILNTNLSSLEAQVENTKQNTENARALNENIKAQQDLIRTSCAVNQKQVDKMEAEIQQGWKRVAIEKQNADTSSASHQLNLERFEEDKKHWTDQLQKWSNDEIFRWADRFSPRTSATGKIDGGAKFGNFGIQAGGSITTANEANLEEGLAKMAAANVVLYDRAVENPNKANTEAYQEMQQLYVEYMLEVQYRMKNDATRVDVSAPAINVQNPSRFE